ncbi:MAG TPA: acetyl-CoA C-acetyltransferase [Candidatus Merdenecus merdavium]|nr:acetyl-CoA C-acetyltransferase [Candidatus Merdenecus merdavium]
MESVVIVSACRTPIGKMNGAFSQMEASELGGIVIKDALARIGLPANQVDEVIMGSVLQANQGQNVARQAAVKGGIPYEIPAYTINMVCGSGLKAISEGAKSIQCKEAEVVVAGGMENMSLSPYALEGAREGYRLGNKEIVDLLIKDALQDAFYGYHMGITAENVAEKYGFTRDELDEFALQSQQKCAEAIKNGKFKDEITPVKINSKKQQVVIDKDEAPRIDLKKEDLTKLKPAFKKDGVVTAGNSSGINDGAAVVVLMSGKKAKELGIKPMVQWIGATECGMEPEIMGLGPVLSTKKLLEKYQYDIKDIDLVEANEAFSAQSLAVRQELHLDEKKVNVNGGAIALGHPVGASGCRILVTLIYELLRQKKAKRGLATLCIGGGMGISALIEK